MKIVALAVIILAQLASGFRTQAQEAEGIKSFMHLKDSLGKKGMRETLPSPPARKIINREGNDPPPSYMDSISRSMYQLTHGGPIEVDYGQSGTTRNDKKTQVTRKALFRGPDNRINSTWIVTNTNDTLSGPDYTGSLRWAIDSSNHYPGLDAITFSIGTGPQTIRPRSRFPYLLDPVIIDGTTQPGYSGNPIIIIDGSLAGAGVNGFYVYGGGSTIRGLIIGGFREYPDGVNGIAIVLNYEGGNVIEGNFLGTNVNGTLPFQNEGDGVLIYAGGSNRIGGSTIASRNIISGNGFAGIVIGINDSGGNVIRGNYIGVSTSGQAMGNAMYGVLVQGPNDTIAGNTISSNGLSGVYLNTGSSGNVVKGNRIGVDPTGTVDRGNGASGIAIYGPNNIIGGLLFSNDRNIISGNGNNGISIFDSGATGNRVFGNYLGASSFGNDASGILIKGAPANRVGGSTPDSQNVIEGNGFAGVNIWQSGATNNKVVGNIIGGLMAGNAVCGLLIDDAPNNSVGGGIVGERNRIIGNGTVQNPAPGIQIQNGEATGNTVRGNYIGFGGGNSSHGLVILNAGGNVIGGGAQGERNIISANIGCGLVIQGGGGTIVRGNYIGLDQSGGSPNGNGGGGIFVYNSANNLIGDSLPSGRNVISGNMGTYQIMPGITIAGSSSFSNGVVGNYIGTDRDGFRGLPNGAGVLIDGAQANFVGGGTVGKRNIVTGGAYGVMVSGSTASGNWISGNYVGLNAMKMRGNSNDFGGIIVDDAPYTVIGGYSPGEGNVISGNGDSLHASTTAHGILISGANETGTRIAGNFIGTDETGNADLGNSALGILFLTSSHDTVGGTDFNSRNIIAHNDQGGVVGLDVTTGYFTAFNTTFDNGIPADSQAAYGRYPEVDLYPGVGVTANDSLDILPPQNFPVLDSISLDHEGHATFWGYLDSKPNSGYLIRIYWNGQQSHSSHFGFGGKGEIVHEFLVGTNSEGRANFQERLLSQTFSYDDFFCATATIAQSGLGNATNLELESSPPGQDHSPNDIDQDGIFDIWETERRGIDANSDGHIDLDLYARGARKEQKDIFVEVDAVEPLTCPRMLSQCKVS